MKNTRIIVALILFALTAAMARAQEPHLTNAQLQTRSAAGGLDKAMQQLMASQPAIAWVAFGVPTTGKDRTMCCFDSVDQAQASNGCCSGCRLEREGSFFSGNINNAKNCGPLEDPHRAFIFLRIDQQKITKVRTFSSGCAIDASGMPVFWLNDVKAAESVQFLEQMVLTSP